MKRLLLICGLLWSAIASAQFTPGQLLTAAELNTQFALYAPLAGAAFTGPVSVAGTFTMPASTVLPNGVSATEQGYLDNSTLVATNNFVKRSILAATGTIPIANVTGGTYNFQTTGSGVQIVVLASGGTITGVLTIPTAGTNYQVGDCLLMVGGNGDAILRVTSLSGSGVATASVVYGGTGYTTGIQLSGMPLPPGSRDGVITGTLTSPLTIIIPAGTYLQGSRRIVFNNNATGAFTTTVKLSNGAGGSTGTGVVLPQGTNNSASAVLYTDGQNDVWLADSPLGIGAAPLASPAFTGTPTAPTAALGNNSGQIATTGFVQSTMANPPAIGNASQNAGSFTTLSATSTITPSQTAGIVGTTTNNNANAGSVGEFITATGSGISLTSTVAANITSISLTAGDWDVWGNTEIDSGASTSVAITSISTTSATENAAPNRSLLSVAAGFPGNNSIMPPAQRILVSSTTTVYLVVTATFTGTTTGTGFIAARRRR